MEDWKILQPYIERRINILIGPNGLHQLQATQFNKLENSYSKVFKYTHTLSNIDDLETALTTSEFTEGEKNKLINLLNCEWKTPL